MSRAFVREQDTDTTGDLPDRPVSEHPTETSRELVVAGLLVFPDTSSR
jgi:hypothetical protein